MPAQVERDHVEAVGQPLGELGEVPAVARDAVQADERRQAPARPTRSGELHADVAASGAGDELVPRRVVRLFTSDQTTTPVLVDQEGAPHGRAPLLVEDAVGLRGGAVRPEVGRERVAELQLLAPRLP